MSTEPKMSAKGKKVDEQYQELLAESQVREEDLPPPPKLSKKEAELFGL